MQHPPRRQNTPEEMAEISYRIMWGQIIIGLLISLFIAGGLGVLIIIFACVQRLVTLYRVSKSSTISS
jgi:hypothetical protein